MTTLIEAYREARAPRFSPYNNKRVYQASAQSALQQARYALNAEATRAAWNAEDGYTCASYEAPRDPESGHACDCGHVRIVEHPDEYVDLDDLLGESYDPNVNPDIKPEILERERQDEIERINRDGVWGYTAEYWNGATWEHADSICGFVGNDFTKSGYNTDLMQSALDALNRCRERQARELEATRPDMYGAIET